MPNRDLDGYLATGLTIRRISVKEQDPTCSRRVDAAWATTTARQGEASMNIHHSIPILAAVLFAAPAAAQNSPMNFLDAHNTERQMYPGVAPLNWSRRLTRYAQAWADEIADRDSLDHRDNTF